MIRRIFGLIVLALGGRILWVVCASEFFGEGTTFRNPAILYAFSGVLIAAGLWLMIAKIRVTASQILKPVFGVIALIMGIAILSYIGYEMIVSGLTHQGALFPMLGAFVVATAMIRVGWGFLSSQRQSDGTDEQGLRDR